MPARFTKAIWVGIVLGVLTTAAYLIGAGRSFGYDAAATFASYVATPNLIDAFAVHAVLPSIPLKTIASNDHVFLSLMSHVIYSLTGSRSEVVYRLVPAVAAGGTVGLSAAALSMRFGVLAGASAGLFRVDQQHHDREDVRGDRQTQEGRIRCQPPPRPAAPDQHQTCRER
ncbi:MAG: hypothetical protein E6I58_16160 [Chloroflexi bacterium]|nr:MAG: hypothetical protein E6I58_16160 [Chloroflexota bacterium]